ncbi:MAG: hypothetical protein M1393_06020 [Candidatus Thermoplasmatota archaeon]|nr:hypothetical protein [Candidatus Thermoplasmatota archaeon]
MTKLLKLVHGIYPKNEKLRVRIGRWERGIMPAKDLNDLIQDEVDSYEKNALELNIDSYTDPLFNWFDIFRPLSVIAKGIELGPLTRFGETNTFYRLPELKGELSMAAKPSEYAEIEDNLPLPLYHVRDFSRAVAFLPGPETFYSMAQDNIGKGFEAFSGDLGKYYSSIISNFKFRKLLVFEAVQIKSPLPSAFYSHLPVENTILFTTGQLNDGLFNGIKGKFHSILSTPSGNNLEIAAKHSLIPGVEMLNGNNTKLENPVEVRSKLLELGTKFSLDKLYVTNTNYLDFLPRPIADKKLEILSKVGE